MSDPELSVGREEERGKRAANLRFHKSFSFLFLNTHSQAYTLACMDIQGKDKQRERVMGNEKSEKKTGGNDKENQGHSHIEKSMPVYLSGRECVCVNEEEL